MKQGCVFCEIVQGVAPASILYSDESVVAFRDIREKARIQFLVVPRQHINDIRELGSESKADNVTLWHNIAQVMAEGGSEFRTQRHKRRHDRNRSCEL